MHTDDADALSAEPANAPAALWVGGRVELPLRDGVRKFMSLWIDLDVGIVGLSVDPPGRGPDLGALLETACEMPDMGEPRRPDRVRVSSDKLAAQVARADLGIPIEVGETPEVEVMCDNILAALELHAGPAANFFGRPYRPRSTGTLMAAQQAGKRFLQTRPWTWIGEATGVLVQAPTLGLEAGVSCVIGHLGEHFGFAVTRDAEAFRTFQKLVATDGFEDGPELDAPQLMCDVHPPLSRKADPETEVTHLARDWSGFEADDDETVAIAAIAAAFAALSPERGTVTVGPVTLTVQVPPTRDDTSSRKPTRPIVLPERNDACWCGSGKKYKKCHLDADR